VTGVCKKLPDGDLCGSIAVINALRIHGVVLWANVENLVIKSDADWGGEARKKVKSRRLCWVKGVCCLVWVS
jgi:hypothetical protein